MSVKIALPTFHAGQVRAWNKRTRFQALRCGRRWGKTKYLSAIGSDGALKKQSIGIFAPDYKKLSETFTEVAELLKPIIRRSSRTAGVISTIHGGRIDFWSTENDQAGRSRHYHGVLLDEAAFAKPNMMAIWEKSIKPTLFDYSGWCIAASNTNGEDPDNFFWRICNQKEHGFTEHHAPTHDNPLLPMRAEWETLAEWLARRESELLKLKTDNPPLVYQQEYLSEFVDWSGESFFALDSLLVEGAPVPYPGVCDYVIAIVDTAAKTGTANDGTAVIYGAVNMQDAHPVTILDWDIVQIEGALLETWLPTVFQNLDALAVQCRARLGSAGTYIEDKGTGIVLNQQAVNRSWDSKPIDSKLTAMGKDERAISVSGYIYRGLVKISQHAYDKVIKYKGDTRNHLLYQVTRFKVGDKDNKRQDDLLDDFCYLAALTLGNSEGF